MSQVNIKGSVILFFIFNASCYFLYNLKDKCKKIIYVNGHIIYKDPICYNNSNIENGEWTI